MSKFYGTLTSDKGTTTRAGHRYMSAAAQTYDGSVIVEISNGIVEIQVSDTSATSGRTVLQMPLKDLVTMGMENLMLEVPQTDINIAQTQMEHA